MDILDEITKAASTITSVKVAHDHIKDLHHQYKGIGKRHTYAQGLSISVPPHVKVNVPVTVSGQGIGLIRVFSQTRLETEVISDKGSWYCRLYFSDPGEYILYANDYRQTVHCYVNVS